jgi:NAD(P)-dependent dehydrogenase (short-subunit alcohol dehydrogenase family)/acyl carrier protein
MAAGVAKAALAECPQLQVTCVDVDSYTTGRETIADIFYNELSGDDDVRFAAYRKDSRYIQELYKITDTAAADTIGQTENAVWLITGGHSGIGFEIARAIGSKGNCTLLIIGRTVLPAKDRWMDEELSPAQRATIKNLLILEETGASVSYHSADLGNAEAMEKLFAELRLRYTQLTGVVHSAGIGSSGQKMADRKMEDIQKTFTPKINGTLVLDTFTRSMNPRWFVVFSSMSAVVPAASGADYSVANGYQDAFAEYGQQQGREFISIDWPDWKETGLSYRKTLGHTGEQLQERHSDLEPISNADGVANFFKALQMGGRVLVVKADFRLFRVNPYFAIGDLSGPQLPADTPKDNFEVFLESRKDIFTPTQLSVARIWHDVLKLDSVKLTDDFYDMGGHSLNIVRMINRIEQQLKVTLPIGDILDNATLGGIAAKIDALKLSAGEGEPDRILPVTPGDWFELSHSQLRFWLSHQVEAGREAYNVPTAYRLRGVVDAAALERSIDCLLQSHESLRTAFALQKGVPMQRILPVADTGFSLHTEDLRGWTETQVAAAVKAAAGRAFDLEKGGLIRAYLFRAGEEEYIFLLVLHHITTDGRSMELIRDGLIQHYRTLIDGSEPSADLLPIQYKDYAAWQNQRIRSGYFDKHREYWRQRLLGLQPVSLEAHFDYRLTMAEDFEAGLSVFFLPAVATEQLKKLGANSTLFINTLLIFQVLLAEYTGRTDIVVGTPVGGREHADLENQVGVYLNTLLLRTVIDKDLSFSRQLDKVREQVSKDYAYQSYPFDMLVDQLGLHNTTNVFNIGFTWNIRKTKPEQGSPGFEIEEYSTGHNKAKTDLWLHVTEMDEGLQFGLLYKRSLFKDDTIQLMSARFRSLIDQCIADPDIPIRALDFQLPSEAVANKREIAFDFNF